MIIIIIINIYIIIDINNVHRRPTCSDRRGKSQCRSRRPRRRPRRPHRTEHRGHCRHRPRRRRRHLQRPRQSQQL